ncbi:MAG: RNA-binding protein [Deltaproteobacteria bacterium]|jgi:RNA recognition motif-containing protein|nr:RNA-binding protein [Deltaproteobacteria bacterium]
MKTIYVGNLPFSSTQAEISDLFGRYGTVHSVNLISDRETGRPRGFGFVEMDPEQALTAIENLNGIELGGRSLRVNEARGREERSGGRQSFRRNE